MFISRNFCWFCESEDITCLLNVQNILIILVGRCDTNNGLLLNVFLRNFQKTYWVKRISNRTFGHRFFMPILALSCRKASIKVISGPFLSFLTQTIWLDVYKNSVTPFCGMCCTEWWSPNLVKSSSWTSGEPTAYRLIGRVAGLCLALSYFAQFLGTLLPWKALQFLISPTCWPGPGCSKLD